MNDFTKAELLDMQFVLEDWYRYECKQDKSPHDKLFKKIQGLIDNYCAHEDSESMVKINDKWTRACNKCGVQK